MRSFFFQKSVVMVWVPLFCFVVGSVMYLVVNGYENPEDKEVCAEPSFDLREIFIMEDFPGVC